MTTSSGKSSQNLTLSRAIMGKSTVYGRWSLRLINFVLIQVAWPQDGAWSFALSGSLQKSKWSSRFWVFMFKLHNRVIHLLRNCERAHATKLFRQTRLHPSETASKSFWQHMKEVQRKSKQTGIPKLISNDNSATIDLEKAEMLNGFFRSQTILPDCRTSFPDIMSLPQNTRSFNTLHTTPKEVFNILSHLKKEKAPWIDDITPDLIQLCAKGIAESLFALFNKRFASSTFPNQWKMALVVQIFKKGDKCNPGNYRPISLLPVLSKVLERVVHERLSDFLRPW